MNWKKVAIERLRAYNSQLNAVESLTEQIKSLNLNYTSIRTATADATPVREGGNKREDALINNITLRQECERALKTAKIEVKITEKALSYLNKEQLSMLHIFYIDDERENLVKLSSEMHLSVPRMYQIKDDALKRFTLAYCGKELF